MKRVLVIENNGIENLDKYPEIIEAQGAQVHVFKAHEMKEGDTFPPVDEYGGFIVGAMPEDVHEKDDHYFLKREWEYLQEIVDSGKPCFGICGGGQLLAYRLGAKVHACPKEIGIYTIKLTDAGAADPLFEDIPREFKGFLWHGNTFEIPEGGELIATGDPCPVEGFVKGNIRGILFHFEVDYEELSRWLDSWESGLSAVNKTRDQVLENVRAVEAEMRLNAERLVSNFLKMMD
jgi:GMP synthase (glutamine-hydrolysing)